MLPPHELKNKKFPLALRGYAQSEVNEHIDFMIEKYTELYRKNDELERELRQMKAKLEELESKEDAINRALVNAQRIEDKLIADAERRAKAITEAAKKDVALTLGDFSEKIRSERSTLHALMQSVEDFKTNILEEYSKHIDAINAIAPDSADPEWDRSDADYVSEILNGIRNAAEKSEEKALENSANPDNGIGEFAGLSDEEIQDSISEQIKKKKPKAARVFKAKPKDEKVKIENNAGTTEEDDGDDMDEYGIIATDEDLKKLFSDEIDEK